MTLQSARMPDALPIIAKALACTWRIQVEKVDKQMKSQNMKV